MEANLIRDNFMGLGYILGLFLDLIYTMLYYKYHEVIICIIIQKLVLKQIDILNAMI